MRRGASPRERGDLRHVLRAGWDTRGFAAWFLAFVFLVVFAWPGSAGANDEVRAGITYFREPAANTPLNVVHPQVSYSQDYTDHFGLAVGYKADIVTGATPQIFGVDAVTSATDFNDVRHDGALGLRFIADYATLRLGGGFAGESDYRSGQVNAGITADLFNRNTQVALDYTHNFDRVCDANNEQAEELLELRALDSSEPCFKSNDITSTQKLGIDTVELSVTQIVTPWMVLQGGATGQILQGFQANPYRQVLLGPRAVQENVPNARNRMAVFLRGKFAIKPIRGSIQAGLRGYFDSWAVDGFTADLAWDQYIARPFIVRLRGRWHVQDSALFYRDGNEYSTGGPNGSFWTGDRELSALLNQTYGVKGTFLLRAKDKEYLNFIDAFIFSVKADMLFYRSLTDNPDFSPNAERTKGLLDAIVIQGQAGFDF